MKSTLIALKGICLKHEEVRQHIKQNQQDEKTGGGKRRRSQQSGCQAGRDGER